MAQPAPSASSDPPPLLALVPCPACDQPGAWVSWTQKNMIPYISCASCGGNTTKALFVCRCLLAMSDEQIEYKSGWSRKHLADLTQSYENDALRRDARRLVAQYEEEVEADRPTAPSDRAIATAPCPGCHKPIFEMRLTARHRDPFWHCPGCHGEIMGKTAAVSYVVLHKDDVVYLREQWKRKIIGWIKRYLA